MTPPGIEPATFRPEAQCLNQSRYRVHPKTRNVYVRIKDERQQWGVQEAGKKKGDKEGEMEELTSNSQLLKAALIALQKSKRGPGSARMAFVQIRQPLQGQSSAGCVTMTAGFHNGRRLAEQINFENIKFQFQYKINIRVQ
jgi:hypothetical protein